MCAMKISLKKSLLKLAKYQQRIRNTIRDHDILVDKK